jgi:dienelactone hydrolase
MVESSSASEAVFAGGMVALASVIAETGDVPSRPGPHAVQVFDLELRDHARNREVPLRIYAPAGAGPFPVILFSHGLGSSRFAYGYLLRSWASHGFAVLTPTHLGSDASILGGRGLMPFRRLRQSMADPANWEARPRDLSFLIDSLPNLALLAPALAGRLDAARVGVGGHSFGGYTAGLVAGAKVRFPGEKQDRSYRDERPRAFVCISPPGLGDRGLFEGAWSAIERPLLEITGTLDNGSFDGEPWEWRLGPFRELPPGHKRCVVLEGADHLHFAGGTVKSPATEAMKAAVEEATLSFWRAWLEGEVGAEARIDERVLSREGLRVTVEKR